MKKENNKKKFERLFKIVNSFKSNMSKGAKAYSIIAILLGIILLIIPSIYNKQKSAYFTTRSGRYYTSQENPDFAYGENIYYKITDTSTYYYIKVSNTSTLFVSGSTVVESKYYYSYSSYQYHSIGYDNY